jgi:hypothetical protein
MIRKATGADLPGVEAIYNAILDREEQGPSTPTGSGANTPPPPPPGPPWRRGPCMWAKRAAPSGAW